MARLLRACAHGPGSDARGVRPYVPAGAGRVGGCMSAAPEMASAGGGGSESAAPEADRPQPRPFLIGVSGGTASGKVSALRPGLADGQPGRRLGRHCPNRGTCC